MPKSTSGRPQRGQRDPIHGPPRASSQLTVVGIGASAGGLEACTKFVAEIPADIGMALILVQHLDPTHSSMMVELLASHTKLTVVQATDGMPLAADHLYVIPPASYLSVERQALRLTPRQTRSGDRLPFDFLLHSLAAAFGRHAVCVILSGTGADGSVGLLTIKCSPSAPMAQI